MRPWIEQLIESDAVTGLSWMDRDKTMFSIPWKHAARHGWEMEKDAGLFKQWAIHTGKHVEGQEPDPKTWKANFRCAMNSLPDIKEVKDRSTNKGHQAARVFRMLPASPKARDKKCKAKQTKTRRKNLTLKMEEDEQRAAPPPQENTVDSTVLAEQPDLPFEPQAEVPDFSLSVEIDSSSFCQRFEVSPPHGSDIDYSDDMVQICQQLENESHWLMLGLEAPGPLSSEAGTSPGSHWSESSSADDLEESLQYTTLGTDTHSTTGAIWKDIFQEDLQH